MEKARLVDEQWNIVFNEFLEEMNRLFPDSPAMDIKQKLMLNKLIGGKSNIDLFLETIKGHELELENQNDEYFFNGNVQFIKQLELDKYYKMSNDDNKKTIWEYITILYQISKVY